MNFLQ